MFILFLFYMYTCVCTVYVPVALRGQKRASDPVQLELQVVMNCLIWMLAGI